MAQEKVRIIHIIPSLEVGGAEKCLLRVLQGMDRHQFECAVLSLSDLGALGSEIQTLGIPVFVLGTIGGIPGPYSFFRALKIVRQFRPDLIQSWLYLGDAWAVLLGRCLGVQKVLWNIRCSDAFAKTPSVKTRLVFRLNIFLSRFAFAVVGNSKQGIRFHQEMNFRIPHWKYIPNGFESSFFPDATTLRGAFRRELGLDSNAFLIGMVSKFHPLKDCETFVAAAHLISKRFSNVHFALVGDGLVPDNATLMRLIGNQARNFHLVGNRQDIPKILLDLDLFTLTSISEGFPNALGEALCAGVPCVATDVGDVREMVGACGTVVPPKDPRVLANSWEKWIQMDTRARRQIGEEGQRQAKARFSLEEIIPRYEEFYSWAATARKFQTLRKSVATVESKRDGA